MASEGVVVLQGSEFHHCVRVSRVRPGDVVKLLDGRGCTYEARVRSIGPREALLDVISRRKELEPLPVDIALGMIRAPRFDLAVEKCTELGVRRLIPFASDRSVWRGGAVEAGRAVERMRRKIAASCKQSGRPFFPWIDAPADFEALMARLGSYTAVFLAEQDPEEGASEIVAGAPSGPVLGIVGPEGGLTPGERAELIGGGAVPVSLGPFRLRGETAAICLAYRLIACLPRAHGSGG
jgi:16S rRNA (uracil1498-N3)-methyltransferase